MTEVSVCAVSMILNIFGIVLGFAICGYLGLLLFSIFFTNRLLFPAPPSSYRDGENALKIKTQSGLQITATYIPNPKASHTIVYCVGNAEDLGTARSNYGSLSTKGGFNVMAFDYPGYGTSDGQPTEKTVNEATEAAYQWLLSEKGLTSNQIIAYGRSLGGGPACELAKQHQLGGLILEQTFTSVYRVKTGIGILPGDLFENIKKIDSIDCPLLIVHGKADRLITISHSKALYRKAKDPKLCLWVDYAGHADSVLINAGNAYWQKIQEFRKLLAN